VTFSRAVTFEVPVRLKVTLAAMLTSFDLIGQLLPTSNGELMPVPSPGL